MTNLGEILAHKKAEVAAAEATTSLEQIHTLSQQQQPPLDFADTLRRRMETDPPALIAEIKFASPSAGTIRSASADAATAIARAYAEAGAACLSVLTDHKYFSGSPDFLAAARQGCDLPLLCKEFMLTTWQIWQARAAGADAILLISAALNDNKMAELAAVATSCGMAVIAEVHDEEELARVLAEPNLEPAIIGINNRNLTSFETDLSTTERLAALCPPARTLIAESGIQSAAEVRRLQGYGVQGFLIGEACMRATEPGAALARLLDR